MLQGGCLWILVISQSWDDDDQGSFLFAQERERKNLFWRIKIEKWTLIAAAPTASFVLALIVLVKKKKRFPFRLQSDLHPVWPDCAIYWNLGNFLKPLATFNLSKSPTFLGNFCKGVKIYHFLLKSFLGNFNRHLATYFWSHCLHHK